MIQRLITSITLAEWRFNAGSRFVPVSMKHETATSSGDVLYIEKRPRRFSKVSASVILFCCVLAD